MVGTLVLGTLFINASFSTIINNNEISNKNIVKEETSISIENKDLEDNVKEEINNIFYGFYKNGNIYIIKNSDLEN